MRARELEELLVLPTVNVSMGRARYAGGEAGLARFITAVSPSGALAATTAARPGAVMSACTSRK
jgi:hypothetical protein